MSSGALLLQQLQALRRQKQARTAQPNRTKEQEDVNKEEEEICGGTTTIHSIVSRIRDGGEDDIDDVDVGNTKTKNVAEANTTSTTTIEVCLGPDCSGGGGGAAILEIEDLVSQQTGFCSTFTPSNPSSLADATTTTSATPRRGGGRIDVVGGGCRDHCTMGPNVYIRRRRTSSSSSSGPNGSITTSTAAAPMDHIDSSHFTKVDRPSVCRQVVVRAAAAATVAASDNGGQPTTAEDRLEVATNDVSESANNRILLLREDGQRWRALRAKAANERRLRVRER